MAERHGLVVRNVAKLVSPPNVRREEVRLPTVDQAREFISALEGERLRGLYLTALCLGLS